MKYSFKFSFLIIAILLLSYITTSMAHSDVDDGSKPIPLGIFIILIIAIILCVFGFYIVLSKYISGDNFLSLKSYVLISTIVVLFNSIVVFVLYVEV